MSAINADTSFCWIHPSGTTGLSLTVTVISDTGASVGSFTLSASAADSACYVGTFPAQIAAGHYCCIIRNTTGSAFQGLKEVDWMGSNDGYLVSNAHIYDLLVAGLITDCYNVISGSTTTKVFIKTATSAAPLGSAYAADNRKDGMAMTFWDASTDEYHTRNIDTWDYQLSSLANVTFANDPRGALPFTPTTGDRAYLHAASNMPSRIDDGAIDADVIATGAIDADAIASNAITSAKIAASAIGATQIASNAITSAKIAANAIGATQIAANAIGATQIAANAVGEIVDAVWDEPTSGHTTAGSFGRLLNDLEDIGIEARFDTLDTNQGVINSAIGILNGTVNNILTDTGTTLPAQITSEINDVQADIAALNDPTAAAIADAVWDEPTSGHTTAGTFGEQAEQIDSRFDISESNQGSIVSLLGTIDTIVDAILVDTDVTIPALIAGLNDPTAAAIADAVWTEPIADHSGTAGSTAEALDNAGGGSTPAAIADAVWDEARAGHVTAGTFGEALDTTVSSRASQTSLDTVDGIVDAILVDTDSTIPASIAALNDPTAASIADAVWDELLAGHAIAGSAGEALTDAQSGGTLTAGDIADAVWDEATGGHVTAGTFGLFLQDMLDVSTSMLAQPSDIPTVGQIADQVWTETLADHSGTSGSTAEALDTAQAGGATPAAIADAVWDEATAGHATAGTFGDLLGDNLDAAVSTRATPGDIPTPPTVGAIADAVWTETLADHSGSAGSTAEALDAADAVADVSGLATSAEIAALENLSAAEAADAVWDELTSGHTTPGTFGNDFQALATAASIAALNDLSSADVTAVLDAQGYTSARAGNLDNLDAAVSTRSDFDEATDQVRIDATSVDNIWNEDTASHSVAGSFGELFGDNLDAAVSSRASAASIAALNDLSSADVQSALTAQGYTAGRASNLDNLDAAVSTRATPGDITTPPTAAAIADAVWEEAIADHSGTAGSVAEALDGATAPDAATVADAVWDEAAAGHVGAGSFGALLGTNLDATVGSRSTFNPATQTVDVGAVDGNAVTSPDDFKADVSGLATAAGLAALNDLDATEIAEAVWNASQATYTAAGSTGESLDDASNAGAPDPAPIADAVWDEARSGHTTAGSFGESLQSTVASRASQTSLDALNDLSSADVQAALDAQGYTTARAVLQDNLDAAVSSRSSFDSTTDPVLLAAAAVDAIWDETLSGHLTVGSTGRRLSDGALSSEIAALENLSVADVQSALTAQGYTAARASNLDNLDAAVSTLSTFDPGAQEVVLSAASRAAVADDIWDEAASGHTTAGSTAEALETARKHLTNRATITGAGPFTTTIFEDDGTTPLKTFTVSADKRDRSP